MLNDIVLQDHIQDKGRWLLDPIQGYLESDLTISLRQLMSLWIGAASSDQVWHKNISSKVSVFAWRLFRDRLPTKANLARRQVLQLDDILCVGGCGLSETMNHLFLACEVFGIVWNQLWHWLDISYVAAGDVGDHFTQFTHLAGKPRSSHPLSKLIWLACVWVIWKERNDRLFNNVASDPATLVEKVKLNLFLWLKSKNALFVFSYDEWWRHPLHCMGVTV